MDSPIWCSFAWVARRSDASMRCARIKEMRWPGVARIRFGGPTASGTADAQEQNVGAIFHAGTSRNRAPSGAGGIPGLGGIDDAYDRGHDRRLDSTPTTVASTAPECAEGRNGRGHRPSREMACPDRRRRACDAMRHAQSVVEPMRKARVVEVGLDQDRHGEHGDDE